MTSPSEKQSGDDIQLQHDLSQQLEQLSDWNANKDSDESWRKEADAVRARQTKGRKGAPSALAQLPTEVFSSAMARLALIVAAFLIVIGAGALFLRGKNPKSNSAINPELATRSLESRAPNAANAPVPPSNDNPAANTANTNAGNAANSNAVNKVIGLTETSSASHSSPRTTAAGNSAQKPKPVHRADHSPELMAKLQALWKEGGNAKHRGDYNGARKSWELALQLCPRHPGFQESLDALPR